MHRRLRIRNGYPEDDNGTAKKYHYLEDNDSTEDRSITTWVLCDSKFRPSVLIPAEATASSVILAVSSMN